MLENDYYNIDTEIYWFIRFEKMTILSKKRKLIIWTVHLKKKEGKLGIDPRVKWLNEEKWRINSKDAIDCV